MTDAQIHTSDILEKLRRFYEIHADDYHLKRLGVFGSVARGDASSDSDVDVVFETTAPNLLRMSGLRIELEELLALPVDVVRYRTNMNPRLKRRIEREAVYV